MDVAVIVNPLSGTGAGPEAGRARAGLAARVLGAAGIDAGIFVTERAGHAVELARDAIARGATRVIAWGGDGTVNEVGRALVSTPAALGFVRGGSGNGLARALGVPRAADAALRHALTAPPRRIDAGEVDGRLFFNVAGLGFDAHVAHAFGNRPGRRGLRGYARVIASELFTYRSARYAVTIRGATSEHRAFLLSLANGPQWGNGATIAPGARYDDGLLDVVIAEAATALGVLVKIPRLFTGTIDRSAGVITLRADRLTIVAERPACLHLDGEPVACPARELHATVRPGVLRVCA